MGRDILKELEGMDREGLLSRASRELPGIRAALGLGAGELAGKLGMDPAGYLAVEEGRRPLRWGEYMPLLFLLWSNEAGRGIIEEKGLFPDSLKRAMSLDRNAHAPTIAP